MLRLTQTIKQANAIWVKFHAGNLTDVTAKEVFPKLTSYEPSFSPNNKFKGYGKITFATEQEAEDAFDKRMETKYDGKNVFVDRVVKQDKLFLNGSKELSAEMINDANIFENVEEIQVQKATEYTNYFILKFTDYKAADAAFDKKMSNLGLKINGQGFKLVQPGVRKLPDKRRNFGNQRQNRKAQN